MHKILLAITSLFFISCGNNTHNTQNKEKVQVDIVEYFPKKDLDLYYSIGSPTTPLGAISSNIVIDNDVIMWSNNIGGRYGDSRDYDLEIQVESEKIHINDIEYPRLYTTNTPFFTKLGSEYGLPSNSLYKKTCMYKQVNEFENITLIEPQIQGEFLLRNCILSGLGNNKIIMDYLYYEANKGLRHYRTVKTELDCFYGTKDCEEDYYDIGIYVNGRSE